MDLLNDLQSIQKFKRSVPRVLFINRLQGSRFHVKTNQMAG